MAKRADELNKLLKEFEEISDNFISVERESEYTEEAYERMNNRMIEIAFEIVYDLLNERY